MTSFYPEVWPSDLYGFNPFGELDEPIPYLLSKLSEQERPSDLKRIKKAHSVQDVNLSKEISSKYNILKGVEPQKIGGAKKFAFKR
jgi:hypothetical protein